jgi:DNA-binding transcriptional ArsR family regulator
MDVNPRLLAVTQALADPLRLAVLHHLMGGPASVSELMTAIGVEQSRLSNHLALLRERGLVRTTRQGRHVIYELHDPTVARLVESLGQIGRPPTRTIRSVPIARARTCYDHLAGRLGVAVMDALADRDLVSVRRGVALTDAGERWLHDLGVDVGALRAGSRPLVRTCLDWTERRPHLAGAAGAALCTRLTDNGWVERTTGRAVRVTGPGHRALHRLLGLTRDDLDVPR